MVIIVIIIIIIIKYNLIIIEEANFTDSVVYRGVLL